MSQPILREVHNPRLVAFRASDQLVAALVDRARSSGVSVSEYCRTLVRERVGFN